MRELLIMGLTLISSFFLSAYNITVSGYVIYDKVIHMTVGIFFGVLYFANFPDDNSLLVGSIFTVIYEIFVYIIWTIPLVLLFMGPGELQDLSIITEFFMRYTLFDEWFDVIATGSGVVIGKMISSQNVNHVDRLDTGS